jgi:hypothetical protein
LNTRVVPDVGPVAAALAKDFEFEVTGFDTVDLDRLEAPAAQKGAQQEVVP